MGSPNARTLQTHGDWIMLPQRTASDNRKSRASGLANHRVVNEARSAERDRMKIDAPYLEKSTATLQLSSRSRVFQTRRKKAARPKFFKKEDFTIRTPQSAHSTNRRRTRGFPGTKFQRKLAVSPQSYVVLVQPPKLLPPNLHCPSHMWHSRQASGFATCGGTAL